jgi:hypothetical protein
MPALTFTHIEKPAYTDTLHTAPLPASAAQKLSKQTMRATEEVKPSHLHITYVHAHALLFFTLYVYIRA